jgi:hypothetical protein
MLTLVIGASAAEQVRNELAQAADLIATDNNKKDYLIEIKGKKYGT